MRMPSHSFLSLLLALGVATSTSTLMADTVTLKDGTVVEGQVVEETPEKIVIKMKFGTVSYTRGEIEKVEKSSGAKIADAGSLRDVVVLKSGERHEGLLVTENAETVEIDLLASGKDVSKTLLLRTKFNRAEVAELTQLTGEQREAARKFLQGIQEEAVQDKRLANELIVEQIKWPSNKPGVTIPALRTELEHFVLESNTEEEFHKRCAYALWKVYGSYQSHFGVSREPDEKVRVVIWNSMAEYYASIGNQIKNPAFYMPAKKLIYAGCDVAGYKRLVAEIREHHRKLTDLLEQVKIQINMARADMQAKVKAAEAQIFRAGKASPAGQRMWQQIEAQKRQWLLNIGQYENRANQIQEEIRDLNRRNDVVFQNVTNDMFETLYHEGFHAFLDNFLFPEGMEKYVPRWLNEGLAQYFEVSRVEGSRLILGQEDRDKIFMLRKWNKDVSLPPVAKVATSGAEDFIVHEITNLENSTKHYLMSWALVHWLGEQKRLSKEHLTAYIQKLQNGTEQLAALPELTGIPNPKFQEEIDKKLAYDFKLDEKATAAPPKP
ncbi:MAG: DUF1570 domain-containing protein [Planctomycetes bacterium]|nr:DUF1570 domain-containing protein [Planctomycetota bacterium]